jgi:hypothetical protein
MIRKCMAQREKPRLKMKLKVRNMNPTQRVMPLFQSWKTGRHFPGATRFAPLRLPLAFILRAFGAVANKVLRHE